MVYFEVLWNTSGRRRNKHYGLCFLKSRIRLEERRLLELSLAMTLFYLSLISYFHFKPGMYIAEYSDDDIIEMLL